MNKLQKQDLRSRNRGITPQVIAQLLVFIVAIPLLPLLISWSWSWWEAWVYALLCILGFLEGYRDHARRVPYRLLPGPW